MCIRDSPYAPADGVKYDYYTTLKGAMEKEDPDNWEFVVPAKLDVYKRQIWNKTRNIPKS